MAVETTVAAIASPPGMGAVGLIRVSGPEAFTRVSLCLAKGQDAARIPDRYAKLTTILDKSGDPVDEVLMTCFHGPKSYTGEDTVELACHGGMLVMKRVLERLLDAGIELASAGEFSQRAFMNGKMDLTNWDLDHGGPVELSGEYEFYWTQLLDPQNFLHSGSLRRTGFVTVPHIWNGQQFQGIKIQWIRCV